MPFRHQLVNLRGFPASVPTLPGHRQERVSPRSNDENMGKLADEGRESPSMVPRPGTKKMAAYEAAAMQPTRNCLRAKER